MSEMGSLLGRWHQWRAGYSTERKHARAPALWAPDGDDLEESLERLQLASVEQEIERLPQQTQQALQHVARMECMGVEVVFNPRLPRGPALDQLCERAVRDLERRLLALGLL
jgi:hypothetical protein